MKTGTVDRWKIWVLISDRGRHLVTDDRDLAYHIIEEAHDAFLTRIQTAPDVVPGSIIDIFNGPHPGYDPIHPEHTHHYDYDIRYKLKHIHIEYRAVFYVEPPREDQLLEVGDDPGIVLDHNPIIDYRL